MKSGMERHQPANSSAGPGGLAAEDVGLPETDDRELVRQALAAQPEAVSRLVDTLTPVVQARVARRLLSHSRAVGRNVRQEVEDMVQEVFLQLFADRGRILRDWRPDRGLSLKNFVGLIAERQTISILRSGKRNPWMEDPTLSEDLDGASTASSPEETTASRETLGTVLGRLRQALSPVGWQLFDLIYLQELSVVEVKRITGLSSDAVYAWRSRLRRLARTLMKDLQSESAAESRIPLSEDLS